MRFWFLTQLPIEIKCISLETNMRTMFVLALAALSCPAVIAAQVTSSVNMGCTVVAAGGIACNGIGVPVTKEPEEKKLPRLFVTHFILEPRAVLDQPNPSSDCLIIGINGGDLLNERWPLLHLSLEKDSVTLMPKEQAFRLRNKGANNVEFRLIEVRR
jgi:hypothetical protein